MCKAEGMALAPWGSLGGGYFKTDAERAEVKETKHAGRNIPVMDTSNHAKVGKVLEEIGRIKGVPMTSVALAYVMHKTPYVFPILGGRKLEHLKSNIEALNLELTKQDMDMIENAAPFDIGFPMWFNGEGNPKNNLLLQNSGHYDYVEDLKVCIIPRYFRIKNTSANALFYSLFPHVRSFLILPMDTVVESCTTIFQIAINFSC
jgi:hypothetical protein